MSTTNLTEKHQKQFGTIGYSDTILMYNYISVTGKSLRRQTESYGKRYEYC